MRSTTTIIDNKKYLISIEQHLLDKMNTKQLDVYHIQVVAHYFKFKSDFINIIQVRKQFQYLLDRFRINPIPITKETKNLFQYLDTQQFFWKYSYDKTIENINEKEI